MAVLGRQVGVGLAIDPQTGAVLSLVNLPGFDNNAFENPASSTAEIKNYLTSQDKPLFNRVVSGQYQPGSTIKPLDGVAALKEGIITPDRQLYSPGYLMVPNPYNSSTPTKYADWEPHGYIDLSGALAQSSDVYFYIVVGGSPEYTTPPLNNSVDYGINGLGAAKLYTWWTTFGLGKKTGIDLPSEAVGFLPTPAWWSTVSTRPWSLGDTYNVSIGQGSLSVTPIQLLSYIDAIANGGKIYKPFSERELDARGERRPYVSFAADPAGTTGNARGGDVAAGHRPYDRRPSSAGMRKDGKRAGAEQSAGECALCGIFPVHRSEDRLAYPH